MSLLDRLEKARDNREREARAAVLLQYAKAAQVNEERLEVAERLGDLPTVEAELRFACYRALRAWQSERDDPA